MMNSSTSTMADQLALSLRAWPSDDTSTESLSYLIARINEQRGSFRSVTEASLEEDIRAANVGEEDHLPDDNDASQESQDANAKGEELAIAREDMIKRVGEAYNTCSQALDLVSLLLTSHTPKVAEATVSPYVKQTVSFGSLGAEIMQHTNEAGSQQTSEDLVGLGWRMRSLTRSADSILTSATRLEQEMERESTYWQQILEIKEAGWPVSRLPGDRQTLGVRFGFAEAHAEFRDRGLVALRRDADGNVELDHGQRWRGEKRIRVRVVKDGRVLAEPPTRSTGDDKTLSQRLLRARNSLFDEELYHELSREGRNLVSHSVRCIGPSICVPYDADSQIEISLVDVASEEPLDVSCEDSSIPSAIAITLRLLLSHAHRQNLQRRSQPPPPITDTPIARPVYSLLRPILEIIQHQSARKTVEAEFTALNLALSSAASPNHTTLMLDINTSVFPPTFGTSFQLTTTSSAPGSAIADMPHVMPFPTIEALRKHIWYVTSLDIVAALQAMPPASGWTQPSRYQAELQRKTVASGPKDRLSVSLDSEGLAVSWVCSGKTGSRVWRSDSGAEEGMLSLVEVMKEQFG
ncbi:hypothetical protein XPA_007248 [Xanthoria parietina]